MFRRLLN